jgi:hypothetical protein
VPWHGDTDSLTDPVEQINDTEKIIQIAAERACKPEGAALAQLAQAQANLAIAAALTQITGRCDTHTRRSNEHTTSDNERACACPRTSTLPDTLASVNTCRSAQRVHIHADNLIPHRGAHVDLSWCQFAELVGDLP